MLFRSTKVESLMRELMERAERDDTPWRVSREVIDALTEVGMNLRLASLSPAEIEKRNADIIGHIETYIKDNNIVIEEITQAEMRRDTGDKYSPYTVYCASDNRRIAYGWVLQPPSRLTWSWIVVYRSEGYTGFVGSMDDTRKGIKTKGEAISQMRTYLAYRVAGNMRRYGSSGAPKTGG